MAGTAARSAHDRGVANAQFFAAHAAALARLCDPAAQVSAHYVIDEDGTVHRLVDEPHKAWHAGVSWWQGVEDLNRVSIGIELVNPGHEWGYRAFPAPQLAACVALARDIVERHAIAPWRVLGHSDVAPTRKEDPGELFDWHRLAERGAGLYVEPAPLGGGRFLSRGDEGRPVEALQAMHVAEAERLAAELDSLPR